MNKFLNILRNAFLPILFLALVFSACEGPKGADGATGPTGPQGPQGPAGPSGAEQCGVCHNNATALFEKQMQWSLSVHGTGDIYIYGNRAGCAECHTHQGYLDYLKTGAAPTAGYAEPSTINCRTCHNIHTKYDATDWALTNTNPVKYYETKGPKTTADFGKGNICAQCHQARAVATPVDVNSSNNYTLTDARFGGHHSPAANVFGTNIAFIPKGSATIPTSNFHTMIKNGCVDCHMNNGPVAYGEPVGGHTFRMSTEDGSVLNYPACTPCHSEVTSNFDQKGKFYSTFKADLAKADSIFIAKGWRNASTGLWNASSSKPLVVTQNQAAAMYAYEVLLEDKSNGIHNPKYARAILNNILEEITK